MAGRFRYGGRFYYGGGTQGLSAYAESAAAPRLRIASIAATTSPTTSSQSSRSVWRKSRIVGYQGESADRASSANRESASKGRRPAGPARPRDAPTDVSQEIIRSKFCMTAAAIDEGVGVAVEITPSVFNLAPGGKAAISFEPVMLLQADHADAVSPRAAKMPRAESSGADRRGHWDCRPSTGRLEILHHSALRQASAQAATSGGSAAR